MWEAITAIATVGTGVAIVLTVMLGVRQIRLAGEHIQHLRKATLLEGTMKIFDDLFEQRFFEALAFTVNDLPEKMKDAQFRAEVPLVQHANDGVHKELIVMRYFERVGTYVKHGLVDGTIIYDLMGRGVIDQWNAVQDIVPIHRAARGSGMWQNFELLYEGSMAWVAAHGEGFFKPPDP